MPSRVKYPAAFLTDNPNVSLNRGSVPGGKEVKEAITSIETIFLSVSYSQLITLS
jgi:hypothetical protein